MGVGEIAVDAKTETVKLTLGGITATVLKILGTNYKLVILLICLIASDTITGWLGAAKRHEWKSRNARWGAVGKLTELIIIALMYLCEWTFNVDWLIYTVTLYFIICEGASIAENIVKYDLNEDLPDELADIFGKMKTNFVGHIIKKLKELFDERDK